MDAISFACPWCNQHNELAIEPGELGQQVVIDCHVCCRPIEIDLPTSEDGRPAIRAEGT